MRDVESLSHDPVVVGMAFDVLANLGGLDAALDALADDGVGPIAAMTFMLRGGETEDVRPEDVLPAIVAAVERLSF